MIGTDTDLSPVRHQAIILTNGDILLFLRTDFNEIWIKIDHFFILESEVETVGSNFVSVPVG